MNYRPEPEQPKPANGNGVSFKWITGILISLLLVVAAVAVSWGGWVSSKLISIGEDVSSIKTSAAAAERRIDNLEAVAEKRERYNQSSKQYN